MVILSQNKQTFIKFEGSNQITTLFVNNVEVGKHIGGYTGFVFDITKFLNYGEENELKIEVDNSHHQDIPPLDADFNFYGGIYRDIQLINTDKVHFVTANEAVGNIKITTKKLWIPFIWTLLSPRRDFRRAAGVTGV